MRIAYLVQMNVDRESGVLKKILGQARIWRRLGHDVCVFALTDSRTAVWDGASDIRIERVDKGPRVSRLKRVGELCALIDRWSPDVLYGRLSLYYPAVESLMHRIPTVLEVNSDDVSESRGEGILRHAFHRATRGRTIRASRALVAVTREISSGLAKFRRPVATIANGICLDEIPSVAPPITNGRPRLAFLGSPSMPWHGVDEILHLAEIVPGFDFDLIGYSSSELRRTLANVTAHGYLTQKDYSGILQRADAAIGTLALYKKRMAEASPLKLREYLAFGLPSIVGYDDTDFPEPVPFLLRIPNEPGALAGSRSRVVDFVSVWRGRRVERSEIHHLDASLKEEQRIAWIAQALGGGA